MSGTAFDATVAVNAVWIAEQVALCLIRREEAEGARFGAKSAFHASVGDTDAALQRPHCLVYLSHRADGTPEVAVENQPSNESDCGGNGNHDIQKHSPGAKR